MKSLGKNIFFKFMLNIFNVGIPIILGPYIVRTLGADMLGNINFSQSVFGYFFIFANFGVYQFAVRELSRVRDDKDKLASIFTNLFCVTTITTILTSFVYIIFINKVYQSNDILYYIFLIMTANFISNIFYIEWANEALENYDFITIKTVLIKIIYVIFIFLLINNANDFRTYIKLLVASTFINNIISFIYIKKKIKFNFKKLYFLKYIKPMFFVVLISNASILYTQLDIILIGELINKKAVAFYSSANTIMIMCNTILISIVSVTLPRISNYLGNNEYDKYIGVIGKVSKIFFMLIIPMAMGLFILSDNIMLLYGGEEFANSGNLLKFFAVYMITIGFEYILANQVIYTQRKDKALIKIIFVVGILNVSFKIILLYFGVFNIYTAIMTTIVANIILVIIEYSYVRLVLKMKINLFNLDILKYFSISILFIPIYLIIDSTNIHWILGMGLTVMVSTLVYFAILFLIKDETLLFVYEKVAYKFKGLLNK